MTEPIRVTMQVQKVQTLADGGTRWAFDLPEGHAYESAILIVCQEEGALIDAVMTAREKVDDTSGVWDGVTNAD